MYTGNNLVKRQRKINIDVVGKATCLVTSHPYLTSFLPTHYPYIALHFYPRARKQGNVIELASAYIIRECGSTLYVVIVQTAPPTYTNFWLTFLLTRLKEALYEDFSV